jgi:hypothetical protein
MPANGAIGTNVRQYVTTEMSDNPSGGTPQNSPLTLAGSGLNCARSAEINPDSTAADETIGRGGWRQAAMHYPVMPICARLMKSCVFCCLLRR